MLTAAQAKSLTAKATRPSVTVENWIRAIDGKIEAAAKDGKRSIVNPFTGFRMPGPTSEQVPLIRQHFRQAGFEWIDHPLGLDSYTEINW